MHSTIANAIDRDPEFAAEVERAEQMSVIKPVITIAEASRKNWRAAVWLLGRNERRIPKDEQEEAAAHEAALRETRRNAELMMVSLDTLQGEPCLEAGPKRVESRLGPG